jgi:hypothetical protein
MLGERGVTCTKIVGDGRLGDASDRLGVGEGCAGGGVVKVGFPPSVRVSITGRGIPASRAAWKCRLRQ